MLTQTIEQQVDTAVNQHESTGPQTSLQHQSESRRHVVVILRDQAHRDDATSCPDISQIVKNMAKSIYYLKVSMKCTIQPVPRRKAAHHHGCPPQT